MDSEKKIQVRHFSYLLRGWMVSGTSGRAPPIWRFSLNDPFTGERLGFGSFEELVAYLEVLLIDLGKDHRD